jgi:hypothetical protein
MKLRGMIEEIWIRAADAKEVGVGNPAEETYCYPNQFNVTFEQLFVNRLSFRNLKLSISALPCWYFQ